MRISLILVAIFLFLFADLAPAQSRCDCREIVDSCTGKVNFDGKWINLESSSKACSRIDYYTNGEPRLNVVMDGGDIVEWLGPSKVESIEVQGCVVCKDTLRGSTTSIISMIGSWALQERTVTTENGKNVSFGTLTVSAGRSPEHFRFFYSHTAQEYLPNPSFTWYSGPCQGRSTNPCLIRQSWTGTLTVSDNSIRIDYDESDWPSDSMVLRGNTMTGHDSIGPLTMVKR
jgi:hypothetical protein